MSASRVPPGPQAPVQSPSAARLALGASVWLALAAGLAADPAQAQQMYRIVGPDGRVTFTDRPPPSAEVTRVAAPAPPAAAPTANLPADLAAAVGRFPVTLYTGPGCGPVCADARALLRERGIPHVERTVSSAADTAELRRLTGAASLPSLTVGRQPMLGLRRSEWLGYLDAAGYPASSRLPASYRHPEAAPLVPVPQPVAQAASEPAPIVPTPSGPGGIRF